MGWFRDLLERISPTPQAEKDAGEAERLRNAFRERYHHFKLLLNANNKALEVMAEMDQALSGDRPFGMAFVRSSCTRVSTNVWQIIKHLDGLAPSAYTPLFERFRDIQAGINPYLSPRSPVPEGSLVLPFSKITRASEGMVGGKMALLGEIKNLLGLPAGDGFVFTAAAYHRFMEENALHEEIQRRIQATGEGGIDTLHGLSAAIQNLIIRAPLPEDILWEGNAHYEALEGRTRKGVRMAMRSSALGEDVEGASFAGQYRSELNVSRESMAQVYKEILASAFSLQAMMYRLNRGIPEESVVMCVGCLAMVDARSGGVLYTRSPSEPGRDTVLIHSAWGLPKSVVDGSIDTDCFEVTRTEPRRILGQEIPKKAREYVCYEEEGLCRNEIVGPRGEAPSLLPEEALELARMADLLERHYGKPQDVEWAVDRAGGILLLQARPLLLMEGVETSPPPPRAPSTGAPALWQGGVAACRGAACGPVFIVRKDADMLGFPEGGVLVVSQALPRWAALLGRAKALVSEVGGLTGHLANVAREFDVPALFGVRDASGFLTPGEVITVDAEGLALYKGCETHILDARPTRKNLLKGSPVHGALERALAHIRPLTLLDPDAPTFRPEACKTFHDITRFCHEKAVQEMFAFGKNHNFPERSSKQLFYKVPMQWWVLNLDDGFKEEQKDRYVRIEAIASIPMLALWEGIMAFPWEGPPALDGKGFLSVMFEATTNKSLTPGLKSRYADRNYFMISRNFCNLSSRLGFHFSIIESLVSDRALENYISFQFKGGAADMERRFKRVAMVAEILERYGFRVEIRDDTLLSRFEQGELEDMKDRLRVLGYLSIHTRQLDMITGNEARLQFYRNRMCSQIAEMLQSRAETANPHERPLSNLPT